MELATAVNRHGNVDLISSASNEGGAKLVVEKARDRLRKSPGKSGKIEAIGRFERGLGGLAVVGMASDTGVVEDQEQLGTVLAHGNHHEIGKLGHLDLREAAIGVIEQRHAPEP
jgi:hypothetical protein